MSLTLNTLRCPPSAAPERRRAEGGEFTIGRGPDNDWVLPDPDRHLSKRHCVLAYRSGQWQVSDVSSNGTFLNQESTPVGAGPRPVRSGDRLRFGAYEIEMTVQEEGRSGADLTPAMLDPFAAAPAPSWTRPDPLLHDAAPDRIGHSSALLPPDFNPLADDENPFQGPTRSDHAPSLNDAFRPPPTAAAAIPDDWDLDLSTPAAAPAPGATAPARPAPLRAEPPTPPPQPQRPTPAAEPDGLLAAFLRGAGLAEAEPADPAHMFEAVGAALRAAVAGIRETLIARAAIKGEFRIEQTMVRSSGNNPLKFSANDDDALAALLGAGRRSPMPPGQAVAEALRDIRLHELATISAMQSAVRAVLAQLEPAPIEAGLDATALDKLPGHRKARAWDAFAGRHARITQQLADDFDSVFGRAFARAYEQALREAGERTPRA